MAKSSSDWRGKTLARIRTLIKQADPAVVEEVKWRKPSNPAGVPVWSHGGIICTGETYSKVVKVTFAKGAELKDPRRLFNSSLEGNVRRAIDIREGDKLDEAAFKALVKQAVALNTAGKSKRKPTPKLLSGDNPQIAKGDGDAPVQAYIAAIPGWKQDAARELDRLIVRTVPNVKKAVKWNSPFYGIEGRGWFLAFHCFTKYLKVTFFKGAQLRPLPPVGSKDPNTRYFHIEEGGQIDARTAEWIRQAAALPGWMT